MKTLKVLTSIALLTVALPFSQIDTVNDSHTVKAATKAGYPTSKYRKGAPKKFSNCKTVNKYYPYGITYNHVSYAKSLDRDKDKMACEAKDMVFKAWMAKN
ncbi:excalibur calcium-binding domain-containing protein [Macrococcus epidermidis]|uniref:excalibur calcium-binding domain-containing protein n=1 Tax=Macrococcus epidermidis TaxID=1902580 RepID=UPI001EF25C0D|nr:excalibur calcium-binding domain-containing protein [Macrococcus epidermidis]MCG7419831.1 excalibur calcium-binding domain-containing protein [Macrococcus epidermidis]UTH15620.1 excalibur calcium-binding domain-containing protein [Macrococcus epidermidis]